MTANGEEIELKDRLRLIESMIAEGRRSTESWGWTFVLWGVAYYVALAWSILGRGHWADWAWPVTMISAAALTVAIGMRKCRTHPATKTGRAIASIWNAMGISMMLLFPALSISGRIDFHGFIAMVAAMLGLTNAASSMTLRWKAQFACAVVWWAASVAACFGPDKQPLIVFVVAIFFCQIAFGAYAMVLDARRRALVASHA
jgi:hypothetical protein